MDENYEKLVRYKKLNRKTPDGIVKQIDYERPSRIKWVEQHKGYKSSVRYGGIHYPAECILIKKKMQSWLEIQK
jgi:hypothetical protein